MTRKLDAREVRRRQRTQSGVLSEYEVARIKWGLENGHTPRSLAEVFDVSLWTIRAIRRGDTWGWVKPQVELEHAATIPLGEATPQEKADMEAVAQRVMARVNAEASALPIAREKLADKQLDELADRARGYGLTEDSE